VIVDIVDRVIKIFERGVTRYGNRKWIKSFEYSLYK
jgi:hypothetical protein